MDSGDKNKNLLNKHLDQERRVQEIQMNRDAIFYAKEEEAKEWKKRKQEGRIRA
jgi:hypothetical protein